MHMLTNDILPRLLKEVEEMKAIRKAIDCVRGNNLRINCGDATLIVKADEKQGSMPGYFNATPEFIDEVQAAFQRRYDQLEQHLAFYGFYLTDDLFYDESEEQ